MQLCERCQQIPDEYVANLVEERLLEPIDKLLTENDISAGMYTTQKVTCKQCDAVYDLDIYTEVLKWDFELKRVKEM